MLVESTLSSGLNSLAAVTWEDAVRHSSLGKRISAGHAELVIKVLGKSTVSGNKKRIKIGVILKYDVFNYVCQDLCSVELLWAWP